MTGGKTSEVGKTRTLPEGEVSSVKLAVMSCANFPAGFNVYELAAAQDDLDAVVHLGDYIYEYARGGYASEHAAELGREVLPANELLTLSDYRTRYGQYRSDTSLQKLHAKVPFITVWDDHEVANDTWRDGAENHNEGEGILWCVKKPRYRPTSSGCQSVHGARVTMRRYTAASVTVT